MAHTLADTEALNLAARVLQTGGRAAAAASLYREAAAGAPCDADRQAGLLGAACLALDYASVQVAAIRLQRLEHGEAAAWRAASATALQAQAATLHPAPGGLGAGSLWKLASAMLNKLVGEEGGLDDDGEG